MASLSPAPTRAADVPPRWSSCRPEVWAAAQLAGGSRTLRPGSLPAHAPAHGRVPAPGTRLPRSAPAQKEVDKCQLDVQQATRPASAPVQTCAPPRERAVEGALQGSQRLARAGASDRARRPSPVARAPGIRGLADWGQASLAGRGAAGAEEGSLQAAPKSVRAAPARRDGTGQRRGLRNGPGPSSD